MRDRGIVLANRLCRLAVLAAAAAVLGSAQAAVQISPAALPDWTVASTYSQSLTASGCGPGCTWTVTGTLPPGLIQSPTTGTIGGIPVVTGTFAFTVFATASHGAQGSQSYTVTIHAPPAITTSSLPAATLGAGYSQTIAVTNGTPPYNFAVNSGALPAGLTLNATSGAITGTPNRAGDSNFTIAVTDSARVMVTQGYTLTVAAGNLTITSSSPLPAATVGTAYSQTLTASGGTAPLTWSVSSGALPGGLSLNSSTGVLSGTPTAAGSFDFVVQVADSSRSQTTKQLTLSVAPGTANLTITSSSPLPAGIVGTAYGQTLGVSGGQAPYSWSVASGNLPPGISLNASSGALSGTPTTAGTFVFSVQVAAQSATATKSLSITINAGGVTITTTTLPAATVGVAYSQTLAATGGKPPYVWTLASGTLPGGLTLTAGGVIAGTPTTAGTANFTVQAADSASATATLPLSITITAASGGPTLAIAGVPAAPSSAQQIPIGVNLSAPYPRTITGQLTLTFTPAATVNRDDPAIQFSTGGRTASFTIPAGSVHATFSSSSIALQTGTTAGTISLALTSDLPNGTAAASTTVSEAAPVISSATVTTNSSGFQLQIAGYSNSLDLANASFRFTAQSGQVVQTGELTSDLTKLAGQWYGGSGSSSFGGQFLIVVPFTVQQGAASGLASVSVQLQNGRGTSAAVSANF